MNDLKPLSPTYQAVASAAAAQKSFVNFDLGIAPEAMEDMQSLHVKETTCYDNFGAVDALRNDIARFLESQGNPADLSGRVADVLDQIVKDSISAVNAEAAFVAFRAFTPTDAFDVPRWHADGWFFEETENKNQVKIALTVKGPTTLMNNLPQTLRDAFYKLLRSFENDTTENRQTLAKLVNSADTSPALPGQGTLFVVGDPDKSAIHSEPPIESERFFMSVVPGTFAQIEELRLRWGEPVTTYKPETIPLPKDIKTATP